MSPPRLVDRAALTFAMLFPLFMAWLYFVVLDVGEGASPLVQFAFASGKIVQALFPALFVWWFERERLRVATPTATGLALGTGFGIAVSLGLFGLYYGLTQYTTLLAGAPEQILRKVQQFGIASPGGYLMMALFISLAHSLFEEYYWRWFVFAGLKRHLPLGPAIVLSALGFMLHHVVILGVYLPGQFWTLAVPFSLCVAVGGGFWSWLYHRSGSLYAPWLSHAIVDAAIMLVGYDMIAQAW